MTDALPSGQNMKNDLALMADNVQKARAGVQTPNELQLNKRRSSQARKDDIISNEEEDSLDESDKVISDISEEIKKY